MALAGGQRHRRRPRALIRAAYLAAEGFSDPLAEELSLRGAFISAWHGRLALSPDPPVPAAWALNTWLAPQEIAANSIGAAAAALRSIQRNWGSYQAANFRRAALIAAKLPVLKPKPLAFPQMPPAGHLGTWTLLEPDRLLASPMQTNPFVNGEPLFIEDRAGPPSRAYLKLWEACTLLGAWPQQGETCLDLGAAPGGWTWALASLGARVTTVDRAPLDPAVAAMPSVTVRQESAFALDPAAEPAFDWLFSDVVAYPVAAATIGSILDRRGPRASRGVYAQIPGCYRPRNHRCLRRDSGRQAAPSVPQQTRADFYVARVYARCEASEVK